jgi:hypothetical protein
MIYRLLVCCLTSLAHIILPAHFGNFHEVIHPNRPKKDNLGANSSIFIPVANPVRMYSIHQLACTLIQYQLSLPSCMWYPEIEINELGHVFTRVFKYISDDFHGRSWINIGVA